MSRFALTTIIAAACITVLALALGGPARWWGMGAVAAAYLIIMVVGVTSIRLGFFCRAFCRGKPGQMRLALTFDDGPDSDATAPLLDVLKEQQVPAAFFCVGETAAANPGLVRRMAAEGHVVGNHTFRHGWWTNFLVGRPLRREVARAQEALRGILGRAPRYFRSPVGLTNPHLRGALNSLDMVLLGWDVRPFDRGSRPEAVLRRIRRRVRDGSIIVLHDGGAHADTLSRLVTELVTELRARGYTFASLEELGAGPPYGKEPE